MKEPGWPFGNRPPARLLWELWKTGRVMSCEMNEHPLDGGPLYPRVTSIAAACF